VGQASVVGPDLVLDRAAVSCCPGLPPVGTMWDLPISIALTDAKMVFRCSVVSSRLMTSVADSTTPGMSMSSSPSSLTTAAALSPALTSIPLHMAAARPEPSHIHRRHTWEKRQWWGRTSC
jgi:hypothetical protein